MSKASDIDVDADLFFDGDDDEGWDEGDLIGSADVRVLHISARRFVLLPPKRTFNPKPARPRKVKPPPSPRPKRPPQLTEVLPKPTFPVCRPHYKLFRPKRFKLPRTNDPTPYELRCAERVAWPRQLKPQFATYRPLRSDYPRFKIGDTADDVDAPMLSDLIDLCLRVLGHNSHRTDGEHTPFAWLLNLRHAVRYYARQDWPKAARQWTVPPKVCPSKPALATVWATIRREIAEASDAMERDMPLYGLSYRLNAYSTFMMVAIVGAARVLIHDPRGADQFQIGARMMPKDIEWWTHEYKKLRQRDRHYVFNEDLIALLRRVKVTEAQIAAAQHARLLNRGGARVIVMDAPPIVAPGEVTPDPLPPEKIGTKPKDPTKQKARR